MRLSLVAAKSLCREMGISRRVVHRLELRAGMEEDAVRTWPPNICVWFRRSCGSVLTALERTAI